MIAKPNILGDLGERALLVPDVLGRALAANDRVKYYFALLQLACSHALEPEVALPTLREDREAAGVADATLDGVIAGTRCEGRMFRLPGAARIHQAIVACMHEMIAPLDPGFEARLQAALRKLPAIDGDLVPERYVPAVTRALNGGDTLHALVLEAHRQLNELQARLCQEAIGGATAYGLEPDDRPLVEAFTAGVARTAALKYDHPGLTTSATRSEATLLLQNDLGTTDAHVLVVRVTGLECTVIHADPHIQRARFLQSILLADGVRWGEIRSREASWIEDGESYHLCSGRFTAPDRAALARFLERLGSRLVFLIDWNRARKRLRNFVDNASAIAILRWAAEQEVGHRAFLQLGGERLVYEAVEAASPARVRYGQRLDEILGRDDAVDFLQLVLRLTSEGLGQQRSERFIRDEIRAELLARFETFEHTLLRLAGEHAALIAALADDVHAALQPGAALDAGARQAAARETSADDVVRRVRALAGRSGPAAVFVRLVTEADDAADGLEEAMFLLSLLPATAPPSPPLVTLAALLPAAARAWSECLRSASRVHRGGERAIVDGFLEAVDTVVTIEHRTDEAQRAVTAALFRDPVECRQLQLVLMIAQTLEQAADSLSHCAFSLRDHLLGEVMPG